jgi:L-aminopeptidase/D-esterase-like protein
MPWHRLGLAIGHATDESGGTGCTVVRGIDRPFRCAAALAGRATGTRELDTCDPDHLVDRTDALLFTGGSAYGLDAAAGVMQWMEERHRGHPIAGGVVPIVPAAVLFDLAPIGRFDARPDAAMAYGACEAASSETIAEGSVGAGTGALVGKAAGIDAAMKGGVGLASSESAHVLAAAIAVVNAFGDVRDGQGQVIAGARDARGRFLDSAQLIRRGQSTSRLDGAPAISRQNTTLVAVALSVPVGKHLLAQVARAATAGLFRRVTPSGTQYDGDVIFALCPWETPAELPVPLAQLEAVATDAVEHAIERAVRTASGRDGFPGLADLQPTG